MFHVLNQLFGDRTLLRPSFNHRKDQVTLRAVLLHKTGREFPSAPKVVELDVPLRLSLELVAQLEKNQA